MGRGQPRLTAALAAALAVAAPAPAAASHEPRVTCESGRTKYAQGATRVFYVQHSEYEAYYVCSKRIRAPRQFWASAPLTTVRMHRIARVGRRLGFVVDTTAEQSASTQIGHVDLVTGRRARAYTDTEAGLPVLAWAMTTSGDMAYLTYAPDEKSHAIGEADFGVRRFHTPRIRATVPTADVVRSSLAIGPSEIRWRRRTGEQQSVSRPS